MDQPPLTAERILSSTVRASDFIHALAHHNLTNYSGSSHCNHRICYFRDGVLFVDYHHTSDHVDIFLLVPKTVTLLPGSQDSCCSGDPMPRTPDGKLVMVWSYGKWVQRGEFEAEIARVVGDALARLEAKKAEAAEKEAKRVEECRKRAEESKSALEASWGKLAPVQ